MARVDANDRRTSAFINKTSLRRGFIISMALIIIKIELQVSLDSQFIKFF